MPEENRTYLEAFYSALSEQISNPPKPMDKELSRRLHTALYRIEDELDDAPPYHRPITLTVLIGLAVLIIAITLTMTLLK